jgi:hypothetical protein
MVGSTRKITEILNQKNSSISDMQQVLKKKISEAESTLYENKSLKQQTLILEDRIM